MLVADLVGPTGHVVGIDRDAVVIGAARRRINERGLRNVEFAQYDSETIAVGLKCAFVVPKTYTGTCQQRPLGDLFDANENPAYRRTVLRSARQTRSASVCARRAREVWQLRNRRKLRRAFGGLAGSAEFSAPGALPPDGAGHC